MFERNPGSRLNLLRHYRLGREVMSAASRVEDQRAATFQQFFPNAYPSGSAQYLYGSNPIVQPSNNSPLSEMLLDALGEGSAELQNIAGQGMRVHDTHPLTGEAVIILDQIKHERPYGDHTVPGELNGWYVGKSMVDSLTYGYHVPVLLQPQEVISQATQHGL